MRHPEDDVALADGCAFMVETGPYLEHLSDSTDNKQARRPRFVHYLVAYHSSIRDLLAIIIGR
jgi:hypothetical protein